jgi:enterobactin synthetase component D
MNLDHLFPPDTVLVIADTPMWETPLRREEEALISGAIEKRRREFRAGRHAAHAALSRLDAPDAPLLRGKRREPLWPPGYVGSIAHCNDLCLAVCARDSEVAGIGIDVEPLAPLPDGVDSYIHTEAEAAFIADHANAHPGRLIFSAKESLYKCFYPLVQRYFGFHSVELNIDTANQRYSFSTTDRCEIAFPPWHFEGRFAIGEHHLVTAGYLRRD